MFILLLLLSRAGCDWVEISQNHYRKEPIRKLVNFDHTTKSNRVYTNSSVTEKQWHRAAVDKVSNVANVRRVQYPSVKTTSLKTRHEDDRFNSNFNTDTTEADYNFISIKPNIQNFNKYEEYDVVLEDRSKVTDSRTTSANADHVKHTNSKPIKKPPTAVVNNIDRRNIFGQIQSIQENNVLDQMKQAQINKPHLAETNKHINKLKFHGNDKFYTSEEPNFHRVSLDDVVNLSTPGHSESRYSNYSITKNPTPKIKLIQREDNDNFNENDVYKKQTISNNAENSDIIKYKPHVNRSNPFEEYFNTKNQVKDVAVHKDRSDNVKNSEEMVVDETNPGIPINKVVISQLMDEKESAFPNVEDSRIKDISNVNKGNSMKGMWKLIKVVADTIYKNTHRSFKSKITYLENLKTTILTSIEDQIDRAWPDDGRGPSRHARAAQARGHVEFPSSESTLMTISFLTFAVFLIKLVLQIIHTYKNKAMMVTPAVVAAVGRAAAAFKSPK